MKDISLLLKNARSAAGLTQAEMADAAGTSQPTIAAYESGRLEPRLDTLARLIEACGAEMDVVITPKVRRGAQPLAALAAVMAKDAEADGPREVWHDALDFVDDFRGSSNAGKGALTRERPEPSGDDRVDALIAALAEFLSAEAGVPIPAWTGEANRNAEPWWFVAGESGVFERWAIQESPACFARRGIFIGKDAFDRV